MMDIVSAIFLIMLCKVINKWTEEQEIKRLIKEGKEMEKEAIITEENTIIDVDYRVITDLQLYG